MWNGLGPLSTYTGNAWERRTIGDQYGFSPIDPHEWEEVGNGTYRGQKIERLRLEQVRHNDVPKAGTPHVISINLDKDNPNLVTRRLLVNNGNNPCYNVARHNLDQLFEDDLALAFAGSSGKREALAIIAYGIEDAGRYANHPLSYDNDRIEKIQEVTRKSILSGLTHIADRQELNELPWDNAPMGRPVLSKGPGPGWYGGKFLVVSAELFRNGNPYENPAPALDEIVGINNSDSTVEERNQTIGKLYE